MKNQKILVLALAIFLPLTVFGKSNLERAVERLPVGDGHRVAAQTVLAGLDATKMNRYPSGKRGVNCAEQQALERAFGAVAQDAYSSGPQTAGVAQ